MATAIQPNRHSTHRHRTTASATVRADALLRNLLAILNRPQTRPVGFRSCACVDCRRVQHETSFTCTLCGYTGAPATTECTCIRNREERIINLEFTRTVIGKPDTHPSWTNERIDAEIAELQAAPRRRCHGRGDGDPDCLHSSHFCPVCADYGEEQAENGPVAWGIIRDVRAALLAATVDR